MRVRSGTPMRGMRGFGDVAVPSFSDVATPQQLQNIKDFYYQAGQENAPSFLDTLPTWALPVGAGLLLFAVLKGMGRR